MSLTRIALIALAALATLACLSAQAQNRAEYAPYTIYYNAFDSGFLTEDIARQYGVVRSKSRGVLTVNVLRNGKPVSARVEAWIKDADGEPVDVSVRRQAQGQSTDFISTFRVEPPQTLNFTLYVSPSGHDGSPMQIGFTQTFFGD